ncbi:MAG: tetratricopeptide repeat protein [Planctomycetes bacterium]|nr:tetratricopeptide repeat protein [Planctomycetota bacterium]
MLKLSEAESHFRQVLDKYPGHFGATNNLAWLLATDLNQPQQALALMRKLLDRPELKNVPTESLPPTVIDTLAVVLLKADRTDEARQLLSRAVQRHPQSPNLHYQFGLAQLASRNYTEAETALQTALRLGLEGQDADRAKQELSAIQQQDRAG